MAQPGRGRPAPSADDPSPPGNGNFINTRNPAHPDRPGPAPFPTLPAGFLLQNSPAGADLLALGKTQRANGTRAVSPC